MPWNVLIAHEPHEEQLADLLAEPIRDAGYTVSHRGTVLVGESFELDATIGLESGGPIVVCGTQRAVGSRWAWQLVNAARSTAGRQRVFVVQMERDAYVEPLARDGVVARYWENPHTAIAELVASLQKHYPVEPASSHQHGLIDFAQERLRHGEFFGRESVIEQTLTWIDQASKGWVLIMGGPGTGKSAILAKILGRLEEETGVDSVPYHFLRRGQGSWSEPHAVVRNLNARLEKIVTTSGLSAATQGLERLHTLLAIAGAERHKENRRLIVVIDGLDEAAVSGGGGSVLGRFLPASLPDNVVVLCASRPNYPELGWLEQRTGVRTIDLDQPPWIEDGHRVVNAYWRSRGSQLTPPLDDTLLASAISAADGNILHAVTLFDAFETNAQARDPKKIPKGFEALLEDMWLRLVDLPNRETSSRVLNGLGVVAIAGEALPLSIVASLLEWKHPADISDFKRHARPFLLEEHGDWHGGEARYRPFHEATREFLTTDDHMLPSVRRGFHELIARRLVTSPSADDPRRFENQYAAKYGLIHLSALEDWERVATLLADLQYVVAALEAGGPQLLLARIAAFTSRDEPSALRERANVLRSVLRLESQWLEFFPRELPNLVHNRLRSLGWSATAIRSKFSGFTRGWGLINPVDIGDEICILRGHTGSVKSCDIDSGGRIGVSGGWDGRVRVWDLDRGTTLHVIRPDVEAERCDVNSCVISADGRYIAAASTFIRLEPRREYGRTQLWSTRDGQVLLDLDYDDLSNVKVAFAGDDLVVARASGRVDIYDIADKQSREIDLGDALEGAVAVDIAGSMIAAVTKSGCGIWRLSDGARISNVTLEDAASCSFSPDGKTIALAGRRHALVAQVSDGSTIHASSAIGQVSECRLLDSRRLLAASGMDADLLVWDMETNTRVACFAGHTYAIDCCAATRDGRFALSGGGDHSVRVWSLADPATRQSVDRHRRLVYECGVDAAGALAYSSPQDEMAAIWDARVGARVQAMQSKVSFESARFCRFRNRPRIATLRGKSLRTLDPATFECDWEMEVPIEDRYGSVSWLDHGYDPADTVRNPRGFDRLPLITARSHVLVWREDGTIDSVSITGESVATRFNAGRSITSLVENTLEVIDLDDIGVRRRVADNVLACVGSPNSDSVYALMSNKQLCRLGSSSGVVETVIGELTQEIVRLVVDPGETALWAICRRGHPFTFSYSDEELIAFSPDGSGVLQRFSIPGHEIFDTCFLGDALITAGWDATIRIWDWRQPTPLAAMSGSAPFRCVSAAADRIVAGDQKGNMWFLAPISELYAQT